MDEGKVSVVYGTVEWFDSDGSSVNSKVSMSLFSVDTRLESRCNIKQRVGMIVEFATILILEEMDVGWAFSNMGCVMNAQSMSNLSTSKVRMISEELNVNSTSKAILNFTSREVGMLVTMLG